MTDFRQRLGAITRDQEKDTGMAFALIALIASLYLGSRGAGVVALAILVMAMTWPRFFRLFAVLWFGLSNILAAVMGRVVLTLLYIAILLPMALVRRVTGGDSLNLRGFKKGAGSVFKPRERAVTADDLRNPF